MKNPSATIICLTVWLLFAAGAISGRAEDLMASFDTSVTNLSMPQMAALLKKAYALSLTDLQKAAETGNAEAEYFYGMRTWDQAEQDNEAAHDREVAAFYQLSESERAAAAAKWRKASQAELEQAAAAGDLVAESFAYMNENPYIDRAKASFEWIKKSADQGFAPAEYNVALHYLWEVGWVVIDVNQPEGLKYLQRAVDHGWHSAEYTVGTYLVAGEFMPRDLSGSVDNLQKSADQGDGRAQYLLAQLYAQGVGEPRSTDDMPVPLLQKAAANGNYLALHALADRYRIGLGVSSDYVEAIRYYTAARKADEAAGIIEGNYKYDIFHVVNTNDYLPNPQSGPQWADFVLVLSTYLKATKLNDARCMSQVGDWYLAGRFMPRNPVEAYHWYVLAADNGAVGADRKRDALKAKLRPEQLEQAEKINESVP